MSKNTTTLEEQIVNVKKYAKALGLAASGKWSSEPGKDRKFEIINGKDKAFTTCANIKAGKNPFRVISIEHQLKEVTQFAKKLGLIATGNHKLPNVKSNRLFEIKNPKTGETRWSTRGNLKDGSDPFYYKTDDQYEAEAAVYAKKLGYTLTGNKTKGGHVKYEVTNGKKSAFVVLHALRLGHDPLAVNSLAEQLALAKTACKKIGLVATGNSKKTGLRAPRKFEITHADGRTAWSSLAHLKSGRSPFSVATIKEQIAFAKEYAKGMNIRATGNHEKLEGPGAPRVFEVEFNGNKKWISLNTLKKGHNPFAKTSVEDQFILAKKYLAQIDKNIKLTGKCRIPAPNSARRFQVELKGRKVWSQLANLKDGKNPFKDSGFDPKRKGFLYIHRVIGKGINLISYGITNMPEGRMVTHCRNLKKQDLRSEELFWFEFPKGLHAQQLESQIKKLAPKVFLDIEGFRTETTNRSELDWIVNLAKDARGLKQTIDLSKKAA